MRPSAGPKTTLRASVARQVRFPTLRDLFGADRGNPDLESERTLNYEIGVERDSDSGRLFLGLGLFRIDADDFIQRTPGDILRNSQKTRFQGFELEGRHRFGRDVRLSWSYTHLDAENRSPEAEITITQNRPEHKLAVALEHDTSYGLRLRGDLLVVADNFALSRTSPVQAMELGDYAVLGLGLSQSLRGDRLRLTARADNLLDEDYVEAIGFPAPGRTLFRGLELRSSAAVKPSGP